jgi:hypothetical protein
VELVLEDGTGIVTANAYATVDEVTDILSVNIHSKWSLLDPDSQKNLVIWATRILDERVRWYGTKTFETSGTAFPRVGVRDRENNPIDDNLVPRQVKIATAVLADHLTAGNPDAVDSASNLKGLKVDVIELDFDPKLAVNKFPPELMLILAGLGQGNFGRHGPKRIIKH